MSKYISARMRTLIFATIMIVLVMIVVVVNIHLAGAQGYDSNVYLPLVYDGGPDLPTPAPTQNPFETPIPYPTPAPTPNFP